MKTKTLLLILLSIFFLKRDIIAQSSYQISMVEDLKLSVWDFQINQDTSLSLFIHGWQGRNAEQPPPVLLMELNAPNDLIAKGIRLFLTKSNGDTVNTTDILKFFNSRLESKGDLRLLNYGSNFVGYDINTKEIWYRYLDRFFNIEYVSADFGDQLLTIVSIDRGNDIIVNQLDTKTGNNIGNFALNLEHQGIFNTINLYDVTVDPLDNSTIISCFVRNGEKQGSGIIRISPIFEIQTKLLTAGQGFNQFYFGSKRELIVSPKGEIYWLGSKKDEDTGQSDLIIMKFDQNLDLIFSKRYYGEKFPFFRFSLNFDEFNQPILAYSTHGTYPLILAKLDEQGEILSETGYALHNPKIKVGKDGALFMTSSQHFDDTGNLFYKNIIAKTDKEGDILNCESYPANLKSSDVIFEFDDFKMNKSAGTRLKWGTVETQPYEFEFEPFCDLPPAPNPDFVSLDTICIGECLRTDSTLSNRNAQANEWTLEGENMQPFISDSTEFEYCFDTVGTYTLRQTIWFLGIDYSFEKIIEVLPPLEIKIQSDSIICESPALLTLNSNRPLQNIEWSTGATESEVYSFDSGIHSVIADDGFCHASDTSFLEFIFEKIDTNFTLELPDSMTVCDIHLPFELKPKSEYSIVFLDEDSKLDSVFLLSKTGEYFFSTEVLGCRFSKKIDFKTDDCKAEIFTPSAFSPNNDGINDEFIPLGKNIEPIRLGIYDRWGGKVFISNTSQVAWDGSFDGKPVSKGVYVFRFEYLNLLSGLEEEISGDVSVLK